MQKIRINNKQRDKLADLFLGLGQILFGATAIPYLIPTFDKPPLMVIILGTIAALILWGLALLIYK